MKIYLDEKIKINGVDIGHTYEGLKYLIDHYEHILKISTPQQMDDQARQHCTKVIENLKIRKTLYESQNPKIP